MAPRIKPRPKVKVKGTGVTKQLKAAAKRAGFVKANGTADVAAYRKHKAKIAALGGLPTGPSSTTDKAVAARLNISAAELEKQRKEALTKSLNAEAKAKNISVEEVKKLRAARKIKRGKTAKKRAYTANKENVKKLTDIGVDESLAKQVLDPAFTNLPTKKQVELKTKVAEQKAIFKKKPTIVSTADKPLHVAREAPEGQDPVRLKQIKETRSFKDQKRKLVSARNKARRVETKLKKLINSKKNVKDNKNKLKNTQEELQDISEAISNQTPIPEKKLRGLNIALDIVLEAPEPVKVDETIQTKVPPSIKSATTVTSKVWPLNKKIMKKAKQSDAVKKDIIRTLTDKKISSRLATKVANAQSLTKAEINKLKKIGVNYTYGEPGSARAPTPLKKLTAREKDLQKITGDPIPEKWPSLEKLQTLLGHAKVGPVKRGTGKTGGGKGKIHIGNLTSAQVQELITGKALTREQADEIEKIIKDPKSELSERTRKKGGTVYRKTGGQVSRGTGAALRGFGKATYSHKLY